MSKAASKTASKAEPSTTRTPDPTQPDTGRTLVGAVAVPEDLEAPNGVRVASDGITPAQGVVTKGNSDDPEHILNVDPRAVGAPEDVNQGVSEDMGGSNPPALNEDGLVPGEPVDFETMMRVSREKGYKTPQPAAPKK